MLVFSSMLIAGFIFWAAFMTEDIDDDDEGPGGGMLTPAYVPSRYHYTLFYIPGQSIFYA